MKVPHMLYSNQPQSQPSSYSQALLFFKFPTPREMKSTTFVVFAAVLASAAMGQLVDPKKFIEGVFNTITEGVLGSPLN